MSHLESYFASFRNSIIGSELHIDTPYGKKPLVYADWTASGRLFEPIETRLKEEIAPYVGNTHTETTTTGSTMTHAYHEALHIIKTHVNAASSDVILTAGSGMTGVVNKLQRILGFKLPEHFMGKVDIPEEERPVVFVTHMEHHSNHTSWLETIADVVCINPCPEGKVNVEHLRALLPLYENRQTRIAAVTACSNVTGIETPYYEIARIMHENGGLCFVDFACSGPYVEINMHPEDPLKKLDAVYFSPHKFLGGPGTPGVVVFDSKLYNLRTPDHPGGGTVDWTNPWGEHKYVDDIEAREDGGTPPFLQTIKAALCMKLKEEMGVENILRREKEQMKALWNMLIDIPGLHILAQNTPERLGVISFYIDGLHFNLAVRLLNDRFGIQVRGGCSCAGTYGHYLLQISQELSREMTAKISAGDLSIKPGWIRLSIHPTMTDAEIFYIGNAIWELSHSYPEWSKDYTRSTQTNEFYHKGEVNIDRNRAMDWLYKPCMQTERNALD